MWRGADYEDIKRDNRLLIRQGKTPASMIDILSIVEHPAFIAFYEDLINEGLVGEAEDDDDPNASANGDLIAVGLRQVMRNSTSPFPSFFERRKRRFRTAKSQLRACQRSRPLGWANSKT